MGSPTQNVVSRVSFMADQKKSSLSANPMASKPIPTKPVMMTANVSDAAKEAAAMHKPLLKIIVSLLGAGRPHMPEG